jgi:hypothetical protein
MRRAALALAAAAALAVPAAATGSPAPLSKTPKRADVRSTYGSGHFGSWAVDAFGLPAYRYGIDETTDPRARQPEVSGSTLAQHQVGNDRLMANAYNDGFVQLWSQDRLMQWANAYRPNDRHYSGGFGWLKVGGAVVSTLYPDRPKGARFERDFGVGYARKRVTAAGARITEDTFAPFGDDPLLVDQVTIKNTTRRRMSASWFEYWDVNPYDQATGFQNTIGLQAPQWDAGRHTLSVAQVTAPEGDTSPLSIFAAPLNRPGQQHESSLGSFFGQGTRAVPAEVAADKLSGTIAAPRATGTAGDALFAYRAPVSLKPGASVTLRYAYGIAHPDRVAPLVAKYRAARAPFRASERAWARWVPQADFGASNRWVARELEWDAYQLRSASMYEEACGHHTITQGGYYQYDTGANLGYRSWPHYLLPMTYADPSLTRDVLRYTIVQQPPPPTAAQQNPYGIGQLCTRFDLGSSNDLDFWLLLAAGEYGLGMRDTKFFDEPLRYAAGDQTTTAWQLCDGLDRRLERLLHRARAAHRVDARNSSARLRVSEARRARGPAWRPRLRAGAPGGGRAQRRDDAARVDRSRLVLARLQRDAPGRHGCDLRGAAAVGDPRRRSDRGPGADARGERPPIPRRGRRAEGGGRPRTYRHGNVAVAPRPGRH